MSEPLQEFTAERWATVRSVLSGEREDCVSLSAAARAAGISRSTLNAWIRRSDERRESDDPLLHEVAEFVRSCRGYQADTLEDVAWRRGVRGVEEREYDGSGELVRVKVKHDNRLLLRLLEVRRDDYRSRPVGVTVEVRDADEIHRRLLAGHRLAIANEAAPTVDLPPGSYEEVSPEDVPADAVVPDAFEDGDTEI